MQRLINSLASLRLTIYLIVALGVIFLLGLWIPQANVLKMELYFRWKSEHPELLSYLEMLRLTQIYTSPYTIALWTLFFVNLSLVMWKRAPLVFKKVRFSESRLENPRTTTAYVWKAQLKLPIEPDLEQLRQLLRQAGYRLHGSMDSFYAVKNHASPLAMLLFHLSFFLMLLGGIVNLYSRFSGYVDLSEGESFQGELSRYNAAPRLPKWGSPPDVNVTVEKVAPETINGMPTRLAVSISDRQGRMHLAEINHPYNAGRTSFVVTTIGVTPLFVAFDGQGRELDGAYVRLNVLGGKQDNFAMLGYRINALFYPDYFVENGVERTRSAEFKRPAFHLQVRKDGRTIAEKTLQLGEAIELDGRRLLFKEMPFWVRLYVVKEYGLEIIYAGFLLAIVALFWRFVFYRRELVGAVVDGEGGKCLYLAGRSEFYKNLFQDEFENIVNRLRQAGEK
jgi:cytochrome c biogenesis protein